MPRSLIEAGFDIRPNDIDFIREINRGLLLHQSLSRDYAKLKNAATNGQRPEYAFIGDTQTAPSHLFRKPPGSSFVANCPGGVVLPYDKANETKLVPRTTSAAAHFAVNALGVKRLVVLSNGESQMLPYMLGIKKVTGPFMKNWQNVWKPILDPMRKRGDFAKANATECMRLAAIELLHENARRLDEGLRKLALSQKKSPNFELVPVFFDPSGRMTSYARTNFRDPYSVSSETTGHLAVEKVSTLPKWFGCSCCDSRALHAHIYCTEPGQFHELYSISAIVPDHREVLQRGSPSSAWLQIELAKSQGAENYVVTGHSKCGGIQASIDWGKSGKMPADQYIAGWLKQALPVVKEVLKYARDHGFVTDDQKVARLTEMVVTQWSASNIKRYVGQYRQVLANYLDIETRQVYPLPLLDENDSFKQKITKTYKLVEELRENRLMTLSQFYEIPAREQRAVSIGALDRLFNGGPKA